VVNFKYPKKSAFKTLSFTPTEQAVLNEFPRYSISFFDDENFQYKRQAKNGNQILSKVISDDFYPFNLSNSDKTNYINGQSNTLKIFYAKILVYKSIAQDVVGSKSNVFYLTKTQSLGQSKTVYYTVTCVSKNNNFTTYSARIPLSNSDYILQYDGETFFTLVGDFSVNLNYPISLTIDNSATTSISQTTDTPVYKTISSQNNNLNFYENVSVQFSYFQYSDNFNFDFQPLNITLSNNLFSNTSTILTTNTSNGTSIRFNFLTGYNFSALKFFGLTLKNTSLNYDPTTDTQFLLNFKTNDDNFVIIDACKIFSNSNTNYFNVVFDFEDVVFTNNFLNYLILEIKSLNTSVTNSYEISYMNFMKKTGSSNTFSVKALSETKNINNFTIDPQGKKIFLNDLTKNSIISSNEIYSKVDCVIEIEDEANYEIVTKSGTIILPESCLIKTEKIYVPVFNLEKNSKIQYLNSYENVEVIKILPPEKLQLIDLDDNSDYVLNGFNIKNPFYLKKIQRKLLNNIKKQTDYILINEKEILVNKYANYGLLNENVILKEKNLLSFGFNVSEVRFSVKSAMPVMIENSNNFSFIINDDFIILKNKNDLSQVVLKCKSSLVIKKMLIIYAD
jgi:hypothetical protein